MDSIVHVRQLENLEIFLDTNWYYRICTNPSLLLVNNVFSIFNIQKLMTMNWWLVKENLSANLPEYVYNQIKYERRKKMKNATRKNRKQVQEGKDMKQTIEKLEEYRNALITQRQKYLEQIEEYRNENVTLEF